jgi:hypothetical protein
MSGKYVTAFTNGVNKSGFTNIGKISIDTNPGSGDYSIANFVGGVLDNYDSTGYVIITDTTTAQVDTRSTGNHTGTASVNTPTFWVSPTKDDVGFLFLVNRLPERKGQTSFTDTSIASTWLNTNGYWTSFGGIVANELTLRLDASNSTSYPGSGSTWIDLVDPQQNITLVNSPTYTSSPPSYFSFNGSNQYGSGSGSVLSSTSYTKQIWFYLNSYTVNNLVSSSNSGHYMFFQGSNKLYSGHTNWAGFPSNFPSTATFNLNTWYNVALTFNTTDGMKLYINGSLDSTYTTIKTGLSGNNSVDIASFNSGNLLNGRISRVYCYSRSLTDNEVLQNFNAEKSLFGL